MISRCFFLLLLAAIIIPSGCSGPKITSTWTADLTNLPSYKKILVLGLIREKDRSLQEKMEQHLVDDLAAMGYEAESSLSKFGPKVFENLKEEDAIITLKDSNFDAILTVVLLDKQKERRYVPASVLYSPYSYYGNRFWRYRSTLYYRIYEPDYYVSDTKYFWESNLYELPSQKLIYSAQTEAFNPDNSESMAHEYSKAILQNMKSKTVIR
jgi:hypothetical protein